MRLSHAFSLLFILSSIFSRFDFGGCFAGPQDKDVFTLAAEAIIAARPVKETIYYRKVGGHSKRITRLNVDLTPTHDYVEVQSWKVAREILVKLHGTDKVFESSDMFKVLK